MKILAISDIHGAVHILEQILAAEADADLIAIAGDLTTRGTDRDIEITAKAAHASGRPLVAVLGNMDPPTLEAALITHANGINGTGFVHDDVGFFGVSGAPLSPMHTPYEVADAVLGERAEAGWQAVAGARRTVLVTHTPPHNTAVDRVPPGAHVGSPAIRRFIETRQPDVVLCGHIHEARGTDRIGKTLILNCGPLFHGSYGIVEIGEEIVARSMP